MGGEKKKAKKRRRGRSGKGLLTVECGEGEREDVVPQRPSNVLCLGEDETTRRQRQQRKKKKMVSLFHSQAIPPREMNSQRCETERKEETPHSAGAGQQREREMEGRVCLSSGLSSSESVRTLLSVLRGRVD